MTTNINLRRIEDTLANGVASLTDGKIMLLSDTNKEIVGRVGSNFYLFRAGCYTTDGVSFTYIDQDFKDVNVRGDTLAIAQDLQHYGDTDTYLRFTTDQIDMVVGGVTFATFEEDTADTIVFGVKIGVGTIDTYIEHDTTTTPDELRIEVATAGEHLRLKAIGAASAVVLEGATSFVRTIVNLTADNTLVTPGTSSFICLTSNASTSTNRTFSIAPGNYTGHIIVLENSNAGAACELVNSVAGRADVMNMGGTTLTFTGYSTATLIYNGTYWLLLCTNAVAS